MNFYYDIKNKIRKFIADKWEKFELNVQKFLDSAIFKNDSDLL